MGERCEEGSPIPPSMTKMSFSRPVLLAALAGMLVAPAGADRPHRAPDSDAQATYVRARAADDLGELTVAAQGFAAAAQENPGNNSLALRAFRQAVVAGDMPLAARVAQGLDASGSLPPDGTLLLLSEAVVARDWKRARVLADRVEHEKLFGFLAPVLRGWIAFGAHDGDPLAPILAVQPASLAAGYAAEHRGLLLIATGQETAGIAALDALPHPDNARASRLSIAAAATLDKHRKHDEALAMLVGDAPSVHAARAILARHGKLPGAIDTPAAGIGELFARVAADINKQQAAPLALGFARLGTLLAPDDSETWLVTANLLGLAGADQAALEALTHVAADDPFAGSKRDMRLTLLVRSGRSDEAIAEGRAATAAPDATMSDWARLGDLLTNAKQPAEAAKAYDRALALSGGDKAQAEVAWPLLLQEASALLDSGDWPGAEAKATRALALAPQEPAVLNFLGYSKIEHGEDMAGATLLITQASKLAPDDPSITDSLGWSWYQRGDLGRAIPLLERAARNAPAEADINEHLGDAYWKVQRRLDARYAWRAALVVADGTQAARLKAKIDNGPTATP
jgi:tetratricopeptide (TPR) repeat protein